MAQVWADSGRIGRRAMWTPFRILVAILVVAVVGAGLLYWGVGRWTPGRDRYPLQGVAVSARNGAVEWPTLRAQGVDFAYLAATGGSDRRDPSFGANWAQARATGLRYGAIHAYSLCRAASDQARLFIASVPRDNGALPPVVALDFEPGCASRPDRDVVLSELNTFLNEIEAHSGKPAILRITEPFEQAYTVSGGINRTIWLDRDWLVPAYASHPWVLWTANRRKRLRGAEETVEWTVVKPQASVEE
ncbi:glycoside hydrolase family 25 [Sphingobium sufflavum]|uniref:GH25 family lysozyme n=1 Tax=Sphingobium sufflavum TaxID=1129547 RepID=UPI001F3E15A8|nr:GH25 family lysozyme [Sphingobium sufflavum]MCE7797620.1 glycoside hydrolase family 25 [Sphingobium sufflavum]